MLTKMKRNKQGIYHQRVLLVELDKGHEAVESKKEKNLNKNYPLLYLMFVLV